MLTSLDDYLRDSAPTATFHDARLLSTHMDYSMSIVVMQWELSVGDPDAKDHRGGERRRTGSLKLTGVHFFETEIPSAPVAEWSRRVPSLAWHGPIADAKSDAAALWQNRVPADAISHAFLFNRRNAHTFFAARTLSFAWDD